MSMLAAGMIAFNALSGLMMRPLFKPCFLMYTQSFFVTRAFALPAAAMFFLPWRFFSAVIFFKVAFVSVAFFVVVATVVFAVVVFVISIEEGMQMHARLEP